MNTGNYKCPKCGNTQISDFLAHVWDFCPKCKHEGLVEINQGATNANK